jgi:hypothetical protein
MLRNAAKRTSCSLIGRWAVIMSSRCIIWTYCVRGVQGPRRLAMLTPVVLVCMAAGISTSQSLYDVRENDLVLTRERIPSGTRQSLWLRVADRRPAEMDVTDAYGEPGKPLALQIELPQKAFSGPFYISITGIPVQFAVSNGVRSGNDLLVTGNELKGLTITAPPTFSGRFAFGVKLFDTEHKLVVAGAAFVTIRERGVTPSGAGAWAAQRNAQISPASPQPPASQIPRRVNSVSPEEESLQLKRSDILLKSGDISAARLILATLSDEGSGRAAYALGMTYDPLFFSSNFIRGMAPEPPKAMFWYKRAFELGYQEASTAMLRLETNN